jgi:hypothetical protein
LVLDIGVAGTSYLANVVINIFVIDMFTHLIILVAFCGRCIQISNTNSTAYVGSVLGLFISYGCSDIMCVYTDTDNPSLPVPCPFLFLILYGVGESETELGIALLEEKRKKRR